MPSPCQVSGNLIQLSNGVISQGIVAFELGNIGTGNPITISGTGIFPALKYVVQSAQNGAFTQAIWGNDNISPSNTIYNVTYRDIYGNEVGPIQYSITGATANLNSLAAASTVSPPVLAPSGSFAFGSISAQNANFTASNPGLAYEVTTAASTITATLPTAVGIPGQTLFFKKVDGGAGTVVLTPAGAQKIDGLSTFTLSAQYQYIGIYSNNVNWSIWTRN